MSWSCLHEINGYCHRLHRDCEPTIPGCVLHGKYIRAIDLYPLDIYPSSPSQSEQYMEKQSKKKIKRSQHEHK